MCYILSTNKLTEDHIEVMYGAWQSNSDMAGIAYHDGQRLRMIKPIPTWRALRRNLGRLLGYPVLAHCRLATHGRVNGFNTHPFWTCQGKALLAHNGIMPPPWGCIKDRSDSRTFAEMLSRIPYREVEESSEELGKAIGHNKVAIMQDDGDVFFINGDLGHQDGRDWYSMNPDYLFAINNYGCWRRGRKLYTSYINEQGIYSYGIVNEGPLALTEFGEDDDREEYENYLRRREPINKDVYNRNYGTYEELDGGCQ